MYNEVDKVKSTSTLKIIRSLRKEMIQDNFLSIEHPSFPQPNDQTISIWRYMTSSQFQWLLSEKRLYMSCASQLGDSQEGTAPVGENLCGKTQLKNAKNFQEQNFIKLTLDQVDKFARGFRNHYFVSCWHMNAEEAPTMWDKFFPYPNKQEIAIKTTYQALHKCFPDWINMGKVKYIDYQTDQLKRREGTVLPNLYEYIMTKNREKCDWENEVRAVANAIDISCYDPTSFFQDIKSKSFVYAPIIDLSLLIQKIYSHPDSSQDYLETRDEELRRANLHPVEKV
jgi:hypothetical protein